MSKSITLLSITDVVCERSSGSANEYYSEGDYWWPDPESETGLPYIRRDGYVNPDAFMAHLELLKKMSNQAITLALDYAQARRAETAAELDALLRNWFLEPETRMEPHLTYGQAIPGRCTGRGIGIIDTVFLTQTALALRLAERVGALEPETRNGLKQWFKDYLHWLKHHPYGLNEMVHPNNHGSAWWLQTTAYSLFVGDDEFVTRAREYYKTVLLPKQTDPDGSFPLELARTRPYGYSSSNLNLLAALCWLVSSPKDNLFDFVCSKGVGLYHCFEFMYPYWLDKNTWPYQHDVTGWNELPHRFVGALFAAKAYDDDKYVRLWERLQERPADGVVRDPELWTHSTLELNNGFVC